MLYELNDHQIDFPRQVPTLSANSKVILWYEGNICMNDKDVSWRYGDIKSELNSIEFIGLLNGKPYFTATLDQAYTGMQISTLRDVAYIGETAFMLCARARGLLEWRDQHRFCGKCGKPIQPVANEPAMACGPCRIRYYPRISPCIIVLIVKGDKVLLAQGERHREQGWYSTIAGFIETGESAEQAVIREVKEEVGVDVVNIKYMNSQAWPFPNQLMLGYIAEYESGTIVPEKGEIADAQWFSIEQLPKYPPSISIAGWMIRQYIEQRK